MKFSPPTFLKAGAVALTVVLALSAQAMNLDNLPLWFEASHTQDGSTTQFIAHGRDAEFSITPTGAEFGLHQANGHQATVQMSFAGSSSAARLIGDSKLDGKVNYLVGNDPAQWQTSVPTFSKVRLEGIYPGVNVVYYGNQQKLEYDFDLAAGVNPETIAIHFDGAEKISVNPTGELVIQLDGGVIVQHEPVAYQTISDERRTVKAGYKIVDAHTATFAVGNFDHAQPLVIDPVLSYSTFFGGNSGEIAWAVAIGPNDNSVYIAGQTFSTLVSNSTPILPFATPNAYSTNYNGGLTLFGDAFVAKLDSTGTKLTYCTYLGGNKDDVAYALAVDKAGHAFVTGTTDSTNFPATNSVSYGSFNGATNSGFLDVNIGHFTSDTFVTELETNGSSLIYSTYLGGSGYENAYGIAVDPNGDAFVTGITYSTNFPVTFNAIQKQLVCSNNPYINGNAFISEIAAGGNRLNYSTYLGGTNFDVGRAIAYNNGKVFVAGHSASFNFPWVNGLDVCKYLNGFTNRTGASDAFVTMFTTVGTNLALQYSTFLGSSNNDAATGIAADPSGNAYVVGWTTSTNFPDTTIHDNFLHINSYVRTNTTGFVFATNAFLTKITWDGVKATNVFSRIFGGLGVDVANGVALDSATNVFIVGSASSTNFPVTQGNIFGGLRATNSGPNIFAPGASDVYVTAFKADFSALLYSAYLGGNRDDFGQGIAVDSNGDAIITGQTISTNFPVLGTWYTNSPALHPIRVGTNDAFLVKIVSAPPLNIRRSGTNALAVYWPAQAGVTPTNFPLETVTNLLSTNWIVVTNPLPVLTVTNTIGSNYIYTFNPTNDMQFYRLHKY